MHFGPLPPARITDPAERCNYAWGKCFDRSTPRFDVSILLFVLLILASIPTASNQLSSTTPAVLIVGGLIGLTICRGFRVLIDEIRRLGGPFRCPRCLGMLRGNAKACPHCMIEIEWPAGEPVDPVEQAKQFRAAAKAAVPPAR